MDSNRGTAANAEFYLPNYRLGKTLGIGSFGKVKVAEHVLTGHKVAIKILNRKKVKSMDMEEKVRREIKILRLFMHPHIIRLYEVIETPADIFVVMEYVKSGELFDYIVEKGRLLEDEARKFFQQIISGVEYCHRNMVVHRDLKPENLLLDSKGNVKIADFGLSNVMRDGHFLKTSCGSPNYAAPEVISGKLYAGPEVDVWSCGVILYALLCGSLPFDDENIPNLFKKIKGGIYTLPSHLSAGARDLIPRMLLVDPMKRVTIPEVRQHSWFLTKLPRYLAVPPPNTVEQAKRIDEEVLLSVVKMGFDRNQLVESLRTRIATKATVAYYLLLDNRRRVSSGYLGAEFSEHKDMQPMYSSMDPLASTAVTGRGSMAVHHHGQGGGGGHALVARRSVAASSYGMSPGGIQHRVVADRKWALGLQSRAHPTEVLSEVLRALQELDIRWKKIGLYTIRCRFVCSFVENMVIADGPDPRSAQGGSNSGPQGMLFSPSGAPSQGFNIESKGLTGMDGVTMASQNEQGAARGDLRVLRFEMQLFKMREEKYLLDVQRVDGSQMLFMDLCAAFLAELHVI